jgi:CRISPR/Cas system-associated exonuclease Cas4 (RecB family)
MLAEKTLKAIDRHIEDNQESSFRKHLGASIIGRECTRQLWYTFRWAKKEKHSAKLLRLFERGQLEEDRFVKWLRDIGCEVWETNEKTGEQWRISDCKGHFGGSLDSVVRGVPEFPKLPMVAEFKTHGDKSFKLFLTKPVKDAKPEHFAQMQVYMFKMGLTKALYMAINKNTDELYVEIIDAEESYAKSYISRADAIISTSTGPRRISNNPSWWQCKFCNYNDICHQDEIAEINCRTCAFSTAIEKKKWKCEFNNATLRPDNLILYRGCDNHIFLPDMIGGAKLIRTSPDKSFIEISIRGNKPFKLGPNYLNSNDLTLPF